MAGNSEDLPRCLRKMVVAAICRDVFEKDVRMKHIETVIADVLLLEPKIFTDSRGLFYENWNQRTLVDLGIDVVFLQDNHSRSQRNVLRGLHYQLKHPQGKLVSVIAGEVYDVAVDMRRSSPTFGRSVGFTLSAANRRLAWIPPGFAHGFYVMSGTAEFIYKTTDYWYPEDEYCLLWSDPKLAINWPFTGAPQLSARDAAGNPFAIAKTYR